MDKYQAAVWITLALAAMCVIGFLVFRGKGQFWFRLPFVRARFKGENEPNPGVRIDRAVSSAGGLSAIDKTGRGSTVTRVEVRKDISVTSETPPTDQPTTGTQSPKA
jgi:hypothetical protein